MHLGAIHAVEAATGLPVIDIRQVTAERIAADRRNVIALLGTRFTMVEPQMGGWGATASR